MNEDIRSKIINFDPNNSKLSVSNEIVSLNSVVKDKISDDEFNKIFHIKPDNEAYSQLHLKLDKKLKYLHDQGYYVLSFDSNDIFISDGNIIYEKIAKIPNDVSRDEIIGKNIYDLVMLMISIYMGVPNEA